MGRYLIFGRGFVAKGGDAGCSGLVTSRGEEPAFRSVSRKRPETPMLDFSQDERRAERQMLEFFLRRE
jgi:hypothetical protein